MILRLSQEVLNTIKGDKSLQTGDISKVMALVDSKIMPNVDFRRMTAAATGPASRRATPASSSCRTRFQEPAGAHLRRRAVMSR